MVLVKSKKKKKKIGMYGRNMGTHGGGARKKRKGSGHRGGVGNAGTGKRADQKKTLVQKKYGGKYFGKKGITSIGTERNKIKRINLKQIADNLSGLIEKGIVKKNQKGYVLNLKDYVILGQGEVKDVFIINAKSFSKSAQDKVKKAGGEIIVKEKKSIETPLVENPKKDKKK